MTILIPTILSLSWYSISFLPYLNELKVMASRGEQSVMMVNSEFYPLAVISETRNGIRSYAMRQAYYSLVFKKNRKTTLAWHINNLLWYCASYIHLTDSEIFGIWIECSLSGCGQGLKEAAQKYFKKDIGGLSQKELAGLVALVRNPKKYIPGTSLGENRTNQILNKAFSQKIP